MTLTSAIGWPAQLPPSYATSINNPPQVRGWPSSATSINNPPQVRGWPQVSTTLLRWEADHKYQQPSSGEGWADRDSKVGWFPNGPPLSVFYLSDNNGKDCFVKFKNVRVYLLDCICTLLISIFRKYFTIMPQYLLNLTLVYVFCMPFYTNY